MVIPLIHSDSQTDTKLYEHKHDKYIIMSEPAAKVHVET